MNYDFKIFFFLTGYVMGLKKKDHLIIRIIKI